MVAGAHETATALDVCTGTASVAIELYRRYDCRVVGLDLSPEMVTAATERVQRMGMEGHISLVQGRAEALPFPDASFDVVVFTFLLRYVDDPPSAIREMARVLRPGGTLASLEFALPDKALFRAGWTVYAQGVLPALTWPLGAGWRHVGAFLGGNVREFSRRYPVREIEKLWNEAGLTEVRHRQLTFGSAVVMWGRKQ